MKITYTLVAALTFAMIITPSAVRASDEHELTTQSVTIATSNGPVTHTTVFRGTKKLLSILNRTSNTTARSLILNGDARYIESDEDGDGFFESIMLPGRDMDEFEAFTRLKDGSIVPLTSKDYSEMKSKATEATKTLNKALKQGQSK
ncbi:MAG TPA: hypothetical protein PKE26_16310 [Kiritimatiellia bacterium]|nr:hypothetical protein [Saprospiraceae bacterium]HMP00661.1 hypothetical protein [Kiritimatiellia bacterium]